MVIREMKNNNTENVDYHPIKFIDHLDRNKHIVLLFDNEKVCLLNNIARSFKWS